MLYDPADHYEPEETAEDFKTNSKLYERFMKVKKSRLVESFLKRKMPTSRKQEPKIVLNYFLQFIMIQLPN